MRLHFVPLFVAYSMPFLAVAGASGAVVTYTGQTVDENGTGLGAVQRLLVLQQDTSEAGSVLWDGAADVKTGDAQSQSQTLSVGALTAAGVGGTSFALILNINEAGNPKQLVLDDFELVFQSASGATLFTALYDAPAGGILLPEVGGGVGGSGHLLQVDLSPTDAATFFGTSTNRVGQRTLLPLTQTSDGPDTFYVQAIPEPATMGVLASGLALLARRRRHR